MSATVDRLAEFEESVAPVPTEPSAVAQMDELTYTTVFALCQAWPLLRDEVERLEIHNRALVAENTNLGTQLARFVEESTARLESDGRREHYHGAQVDALRDQLAAAAREINRLEAELASVPRRLGLAEKVCASVDPHHAGRGSSWAYFDGLALDEWRKAQPGAGA